MCPDTAVDIEHWCLKCAEYRVGITTFGMETGGKGAWGLPAHSYWLCINILRLSVGTCNLKWCCSL